MGEVVKTYNKGDIKGKYDLERGSRYDLYEILTDTEMLRDLRKAYIDSLEKPYTKKVISNIPDWYDYNNGVFSMEKINKKRLFEIMFQPSDRFEEEVVNYFLNAGPTRHEVKALEFEGETYYLYVPMELEKIGKNYRTYGVLPITEDLYNLTKIQFRDFNAVTKDNLTMYRDFFEVSEKPYSIVYESRLEDLRRIKNYNQEEYNALLSSYEREIKLVKTLR